ECQLPLHYAPFAASNANTPIACWKPRLCVFTSDRRGAFSAMRSICAAPHKCAFGEISLTMTQVRAIEILLRKCIPDLATAEIKSEQTHRYVVEVPPVLDRDEWQRKYGQDPSLPPPSLQ